MTSPLTKQITVDGPAASGKSTVARRLAEKLDAYYVNTGEMYRAITAVALTKGTRIDTDPAAVIELLDEIKLSFRPSPDGQEKQLILRINDVPVDSSLARSPAVTDKVSAIAKIPEVRQWLVPRQRESAALGLIVMEGRDIGTVIFPDAAHKFFISASPEERARRRLAQSDETGANADIASVTNELIERDRIDSTRAVAPLKAAPDAVTIDTTDLTIDQVIDKMIEIIRT